MWGVFLEAVGGEAVEDLLDQLFGFFVEAEPVYVAGVVDQAGVYFDDQVLIEGVEDGAVVAKADLIAELPDVHGDLAIGFFEAEQVAHLRAGQAGELFFNFEGYVWRGGFELFLQGVDLGSDVFGDVVLPDGGFLVAALPGGLLKLFADVV